MSKHTVASLVVLSALLAACGDTGRTPTAPELRSSRNDVPTDILGSATVDGPSDLSFASAAASSQRSASVRAATGGRASGRIGLTLGSGFFTNILTEEYSFVALTTANAPTPFAAKGTYDMTLTTRSGVVQEFEGDIVCMVTVGNAARMVGQLTKVTINGVPRAINPAASHNIWNVTDNGEGNATTDTGSPLIFFPANIAPLHCASDFIPPQFPTQAGHVQVKP